MSGPVYEIRLSPIEQSFIVSIGETSYRMSLTWNDQLEGSWVLDIDDIGGNPIVHGIPLVAGIDLLGQYSYLRIGGGVFLYAVTDGDMFTPPTRDNLGKNSHLLFQAWQ